MHVHANAPFAPAFGIIYSCQFCYHSPISPNFHRETKRDFFMALINNFFFLSLDNYME